MKLKDILATVGSGLISTLVPGVVSMINGVLPDDKQLPENATGAQAQAAISSLPPEQQAAVMSKEYDVDITQIKQSNETLRTMLESDAQNPHSTRPYIAKGAFFVVAYSDVVAISIWAWAVITSEDPLKNLTDGWPFILAVTGTLVTLLLAYFGVLKSEHKNKLDAAAGTPQPSGLSAVVSSLFKR